jgi:hypothetical protein
MRRLLTAYLLLLTALSSILLSTPCSALDSPAALREIYASAVDRTLTLPPVEQRYYADLLRFTLQQAGQAQLPAQFILMVDRNPRIQAALLFWYSPVAAIELIGASPASTGKENGYDYFETPTGIFEHHPGNLDFHSEGTKNKMGLMGYGNKGLRVYDFGWVRARKSWVSEIGLMRLQLHATDPERLEPRLGIPLSKGCIRIPAALNKFLDHYAILDAAYEAGSSRNILRVLDPQRVTTPWPGRYMVVVDSRRSSRPDWSPLPTAIHHSLPRK